MAGRRLDPDPGRLAPDRVVRLVRLLRMARAPLLNRRRHRPTPLPHNRIGTIEAQRHREPKRFTTKTRRHQEHEETSVARVARVNLLGVLCVLVVNLLLVLCVSVSLWFILPFAPTQNSPTSEMYHPAVGVKHGLVHHLRERRVREYRVHEVGLGGLELHGHRIALDQLRDLGADLMHPEELHPIN